MDEVIDPELGNSCSDHDTVNPNNEEQEYAIAKMKHSSTQSTLSKLHFLLMKKLDQHRDFSNSEVIFLSFGLMLMK